MSETTAVAVGDPDPTPELDRIDDYCWAPHRLPEREFSVYCSWPFGHDGAHVSADQRGKKRVVVAVWTDREPPEGFAWSPRDRQPWVMGPAAMKLTAAAWTDEMAREGAATGVNRQCSIGWHSECAHQDTCLCACHAEVAR